jgi:hypothetical protein
MSRSLVERRSVVRMMYGDEGASKVMERSGGSGYGFNADKSLLSFKDDGVEG